MAGGEAGREEISLKEASGEVPIRYSESDTSRLSVASPAFSFSSDKGK